MRKLDKIMNYLNGHSKVVAVDKHSYTLDNGDVIEHTFELPDNISVEDFQVLLDKAKNTINNLLNDVSSK